MYSDSSFVKKRIKIACVGTVSKAKDKWWCMTIEADDNSMNLQKPKAFSDTREVLFTERKGLTGMMGSEVEIVEAISFLG